MTPVAVGMRQPWRDIHFACREINYLNWVWRYIAEWISLNCKMYNILPLQIIPRILMPPKCTLSPDVGEA